MPRPIWSGSLSFGLLNIPVQLMAGTRGTDLSFRMLDARDKSPIRYERVNAETGEEVPWKEIVKAFEYDKGSYVVLEQEDIRSAAPESHDAIEVEAFVDVEAIGPQYFEKPYVLVPAKKAEKGYVLLRETLKRTGRIGIARIVIRSRENLCALLPQGDALLLVMMRYPQELVDVGDYAIPAGQAGDYRVSSRELEMAEALIASMESDWKPEAYKDEFRARLQKVIEKRIKAKGGKVRKPLDEPALRDDDATNVVDFMSLLQKSIDAKRRTPATRAAKPAKADKPAKAAKAAKAAKTARKAAPAKPKPAKRAARTKVAR